MQSEISAAGLEADPRYQSLIKRRSRFAWCLTAEICAIFFGYILLVAFRPDILALPVGDGVTSLGIPLGVGVIVSGIALTGLYIWRANRDFDPLLGALRREYDV